MGGYPCCCDTGGPFDFYGPAPAFSFSDTFDLDNYSPYYTHLVYRLASRAQADWADTTDDPPHGNTLQHQLSHEPYENVWEVSANPGSGADMACIYGSLAFSGSTETVYFLRCLNLSNPDVTPPGSSEVDPDMSTWTYSTHAAWDGTDEAIEATAGAGAYAIEASKAPSVVNGKTYLLAIQAKHRDVRYLRFDATNLRDGYVNSVIWDITPGAERLVSKGSGVPWANAIARDDGDVMCYALLYSSSTGIATASIKVRLSNSSTAPSSWDGASGEGTIVRSVNLWDVTTAERGSDIVCVDPETKEQKWIYYNQDSTTFDLESPVNSTTLTAAEGTQCRPQWSTVPIADGVTTADYIQVGDSGATRILTRPVVQVVGATTYNWRIAVTFDLDRDTGAVENAYAGYMLYGGSEIGISGAATKNPEPKAWPPRDPNRCFSEFGPAGFVPNGASVEFGVTYGDAVQTSRTYSGKSIPTLEGAPVDRSGSPTSFYFETATATAGGQSFAAKILSADSDGETQAAVVNVTNSASPHANPVKLVVNGVVQESFTHSRWISEVIVANGRVCWVERLYDGPGLFSADDLADTPQFRLHLQQYDGDGTLTVDDYLDSCIGIAQQRSNMSLFGFSNPALNACPFCAITGSDDLLYAFFPLCDDRVIRNAGDEPTDSELRYTGTVAIAWDSLGYWPCGRYDISSVPSIYPNEDDTKPDGRFIAGSSGSPSRTYAVLTRGSYDCVKNHIELSPSKTQYDYGSCDA